MKANEGADYNLTGAGETAEEALLDAVRSNTDTIARALSHGHAAGFQLLDVDVERREDISEGKSGYEGQIRHEEFPLEDVPSAAVPPETSIVQAYSTVERLEGD